MILKLLKNCTVQFREINVVLAFDQIGAFQVGWATEEFLILRWPMASLSFGMAATDKRAFQILFIVPTVHEGSHSLFVTF